MTEKLIVKEPVFIEDSGQRVAVILPIEIYENLRALAGTRQAQPEQPDGPFPGFEREKAAFMRMKPELSAKYPGKCVAIVGGKVVEVGDDKIKVIERVYEQFGHVPMYVQWVTDKPRVYRFPYRKVVRS